MDRIHSVFISIYNVILCLAREAGATLESILYALYAALVKFPCLWESRRSPHLLQVAMIFKKLGCLFEYEHMLEKISIVPSPMYHPPSGEVCQLLAASLPHTTAIIHQVLANCWRTTTAEDTLPSDLRLPCLQRAAQFKNGYIVMAVLDSQHALDPHGGFNQQYSRVSNWLKSTSGSGQCIRARIGIDSRDLSQQTSLFVAAASGSEKACLALITGLADPNARDDQGHTVLEVAARGGHLEIVKTLFSVGAELNPNLHHAASSPLQAAIESDNHNDKLVQYLLDNGAYVGIPRGTDSRTAIDIAMDKGYNKRAESMRSLLISSQPQFPFMDDQMFRQDPD